MKRLQLRKRESAIKEALRAVASVIRTGIALIAKGARPTVDHRPKGVVCAVTAGGVTAEWPPPNYGTGRDERTGAKRWNGMVADPLARWIP